MYVRNVLDLFTVSLSMTPNSEVLHPIRLKPELTLDSENAILAAYHFCNAKRFTLSTTALFDLMHRTRKVLTPMARILDPCALHICSLPLIVSARALRLLSRVLYSTANAKLKKARPSAKFEGIDFASLAFN